MGNKCFGKNQPEQLQDAVYESKQNPPKTTTMPMAQIEAPAPAKLQNIEDGFQPPRIIEIERKGSGRKQSIKSMSNLIHEELQQEKDKMASPDKKDVQSKLEQFSIEKRQSILSLTIQIEEPQYEEVDQKDVDTQQISEEDLLSAENQPSHQQSTNSEVLFDEDIQNQQNKTERAKTEHAEIDKVIEAPADQILRIPYREPSINIEETESLRFENKDEQAQDLRNTMAQNLEIGEDESNMNESNLLDSINGNNPMDQMSDYDRLGSIDQSQNEFSQSMAFPQDNHQVNGLQQIQEEASLYEESQKLKLVQYERSTTIDSEADIRGTITDATQQLN